MNVSNKRLAEVEAARQHGIHNFPLLVTSESLAAHLLGPEVGQRVISLEQGTLGFSSINSFMSCSLYVPIALLLPVWMLLLLR